MPTTRSLESLSLKATETPKTISLSEFIAPITSDADISIHVLLSLR